MKKLVILLGLTFTCVLNSQNIFQKGKIILNDGVILNGLILDENWYEVPSEIIFKNNDSSNEREIEASTIKRLEIFNKYSFERHEVNIEFYSKIVSQLSKNRKSEFEKQNLLLKVLIQGETSLLKYSKANVDYFFYKKNDSIQPLEYKLYKTSNNRLGENLNYKKTLKDNFKCDKDNLSKSNIKYDERSLVKFFIKYHECNDFGYETYVDLLEGKGDFNLRAKVGIGFSTIAAPSDGLNDSNQVVIKLGAEFEYIFPFSNNSWSMFFESNYHSFKGESFIFLGTATVPSSGREVRVYRNSQFAFTSIENHIGVRRYLQLNKKQSMFINTGILFDIVLNSQLDDDDTNSNSTLGFFLGTGYDFNKKINLELRYNFTRDLTEIDLFSTNYSNISLKLGYNFM